MSEQKTHADIIAEMRREADADICLGHGTAGVLKRNLADRLDAARKREVDELRKQVGNAAKLREALVKAEAVLDGIRMMVLQGQEYDIHLLDIEGSLKKCRAALAAPPRNCDRYTGEDINRDVADACTRADNDSMLDYDCEELPIRWLLSTTAQVDEYLKHKNEEDKKMWKAIFDRRQQKTDA